MNTLKTTFNKVIHRAAEATGKFLGNKIADKIVKPDQNLRNAEEIIISPAKREEVLKE